MIFGNSHTVDHGIKLQSKGQDYQIADEINLRHLRKSHCQNLLNLALEPDNIGKKHSSKGHHIIDHKIPEVCPLEHSKKHTDHQKMRHQKLLLPEASILHGNLCGYVFLAHAP